MSRDWMFLPEKAEPFMLAAVRSFGKDAATNPPAGAARGDAETLGRDLLFIAFGAQESDGALQDMLAELARHPDSQQARDQLTDRAGEAFESDPAVVARAAAAIAAFHRSASSTAPIPNWQARHSPAW